MPVNAYLYDLVVRGGFRRERVRHVPSFFELCYMYLVDIIFRIYCFRA